MAAAVDRLPGLWRRLLRASNGFSGYLTLARYFAIERTTGTVPAGHGRGMALTCIFTRHSIWAVGPGWLSAEHAGAGWS
jgi:hypothetical protein